MNQQDKQFDPEIITAFINNKEAVNEIYDMNKSQIV
jgi:hypothetical protein